MAAEDLADRLSAIAEEIGDLALDALREAATSAGADDGRDAALLAEEKRLTRARRAVEKAAHILRGRAGDDGGT